MTSVARETMRKKRTKRRNWTTNDTFELIKRKREVKAKSPEYKKLRSGVQKMLQRDKQAELDALCSELEENAKKGNSRLAFQTVKELTKPFHSRTIAIKDNNGRKLVEPEKVCQRYCE